MTLETLNALRARNGKTQLSSWKNGKAKLAEAIAKEEEEALLADRTDPTMPMGENGNELVDELPVQSTAEPVSQEATPSDLSDVEGQTEPQTEAPLIPRGAIGAMSIELLTGSDEPYADIVAKIVAKYPTAKTTARSLASVAMDLRRDGVEVPSRRKPAKAKQAKAGEATWE